MNCPKAVTRRAGVQRLRPLASVSEVSAFDVEETDANGVRMIESLADPLDAWRVSSRALRLNAAKLVRDRRIETSCVT
jgi:hypothetical protein